MRASINTKAMVPSTAVAIKRPSPVPAKASRKPIVSGLRGVSEEDGNDYNGGWGLGSLGSVDILRAFHRETVSVHLLRSEVMSAFAGIAQLSSDMDSTSLSKPIPAHGILSQPSILVVKAIRGCKNGATVRVDFPQSGTGSTRCRLLLTRPQIPHGFLVTYWRMVRILSSESRVRGVQYDFRSFRLPYLQHWNGSTCIYHRQLSHADSHHISVIVSIFQDTTSSPSNMRGDFCLQASMYNPFRCRCQWDHGSLHYIMSTHKQAYPLAEIFPPKSNSHDTYLVEKVGIGIQDPTRLLSQLGLGSTDRSSSWSQRLS